MAQTDLGTIDPNSTSGTALAALLNNWRTTLYSLHSGSSRPSYATAGLIWRDTSASPWVLKLYDGTADATLGTIDPSTHVFTPADSGAYRSGGTDVAVTDGGTGASTAAGARTNLGLVLGTDVQAYSAMLAAVAGLASAGLIARTGSGAAAARSITAGTGITVTNGDGVSSNPAVAADVASQAEAEAGTSSTKLMTPQRTAQAIAALAAGGSGAQVSATYATNTAVNGSTIPYDDTVPTNSEGTQILSVSLTPSTSSKTVRVSANIAGQGSGNLIAALFRGTTCIDAKCVYASNPAEIVFDVLDSPATTSSTTYSVRVYLYGRLNGENSARYFGGAQKCSLIAYETD